MLRSRTVHFRIGQMTITNFVLGERIIMINKGIEVEVILIKSSLHGYNLLYPNTFRCVFPGAKIPTNYTSYQIPGTIPIVHPPELIFKPIDNE